MIWKKEVFGRNSLDGLSVIGIFFLIINFYQSSYLLMFLGTLLIVMSWMGKYYLQHVADHLVIENNKESIKVSVGEEFKLPLKFTQLSRLPIIHATLRIKLEPIIEAPNLHSSSSSDKRDLELTIPFQIKGKESVQVSLPLNAVKRGVTRVKSLEITVTNFFGVGYVELLCIPFLHQEIVIYPNLIPVPKIEQLIATKSYGYFSSSSSMFEDVLAPIGTRDYVYSDPFQRIHWKQSAKAQVLQTKVFERTAEYSWTFIINLRDIDLPNYRMNVIENLDSIASNIAYMARYATLKNIEYEIVLNLNMESGVPVYHLPVGGGSTQLGKTFEILARINRERSTQPISKLLHFVEKQQLKSPVVILCGPFGREGDRYFAQMQKRGQKVYYLQDDEQHPSIVPL
ncbi:DUF58 domain-containing protein [Gottfriedia solisilvae]|uniref:DUF58 domain-containing protein n=1 Tax=Gottfriedia solisilvae TaxID=1516104 RepID=A0A8J3F2R4_9BACI|nr:DUF58 domain-containing protein [Gottfriedia solisilvae]GGI14781.1 hypothetical protein GCM10007380_24670 [Gottfriedia solisilvae]